MLKRSNVCTKKGDTLIEVMFAVGIFGLAAVGAISLMNKGLAVSQNNLETTMARQEIDTQAEALRFIHNAYLTEKETTIPNADPDAEPTYTNNYRNLWRAIIDQAYEPYKDDGNVTGTVLAEDPEFFSRTIPPDSVCDGIFTTVNSNGAFDIPQNSFVINPRGLEKLSDTDTDGNPITLSDTDIKQNILAVKKDSAITGVNFTLSPVYPRLLYGTNGTTSVDCQSNLSDACTENNMIAYNNSRSRLDESQGIWVTAIKSESGVTCNGDDEFRPDFYDFHIQTCWDSARGDAAVASSTVRLFNPDQISLKKSSDISFEFEKLALYFVTTWNEKNDDIDSYFSGKDEDGNNFTIYYGRKTAGHKKQYSFITSGEEVFTMQLDIDARYADGGTNYNSSTDTWCGTHCGGSHPGYVEVVAFRGLYPGVFNFWTQDYTHGTRTDHQGWNGIGQKVRIFLGYADAGIGQWPRTVEPIQTFENDGPINVKLEILENGFFKINDGPEVRFSAEDAGIEEHSENCFAS